MCISPIIIIVIQDHSVDKLFNGCLVEMPTILYSLFHKVVSTTSSPIGVEGGGKPQSGRTFQFKKIICPNGFNSGCFELHISQNVATSMPSLTSQSCGDSLPAVCLAGQVGAIYKPPKHPWTPDRSVNEASVKVNR